MRLPAGRGRGKWFGVLCAVGLTGGCGPGAVERKPGSEPGEAVTPPPLTPPTPAPLKPSESPEVASPLKPRSGLRVTRDERLWSAPYISNDAPSLSLRSDGEPEVTYPISLGVSRAYFARRETDAQGNPTWSTEQLPIPAATAVLQRRSDGTPLVLVDDGAFGVSLWARETSGWRRLEDLAPRNSAKTGGFVIDAQDTPHVVPTSLSFELDYWRKETVWEKAHSYTAGGSQILAPRLSLSPTGQAHLAFFAGDNLWWAAPPANAEQVFADTDHNEGRTYLLVTEGGAEARGQPHLLARWGSSLKYATREADGWKTRVVQDAWNDSECQYLSEGNSSYLQVCTWDYNAPAPVALVERGGEVIIAYVHHRQKGRSTAHCIEERRDEIECGPTQEQVDEVKEWELRLATPTADGFDVRSFPMSTTPRHGSGQVDARGRIHLVFSDDQPATRGVRYLMLE